MQHRRWRAGVLSAILLAAAAYGCSSDNNPTQPPTPQPLSLSGSIGPGGGTLSSDDGLMSLSVPAGVLANDTEISVTEIDVSQVATDYSDLHPFRAFEISPTGIDLGPNSEWSVSFDTPTMTKSLGDQVRRPMPIATTAIHPIEGAVQIRVPPQDLIKTLPGIFSGDNSEDVPPDQITIRGFGGDQAVLTLLPESGSTSSFVWLGGDGEVPLMITEGENFDLSLRIAMSHDLVFPAELMYVGGEGTSGVTSQVADDTVLSPVATGSYSTEGSWADLQLSFHVNIAGIVNTQPGIKFTSSMGANYWDSHPNVVPPSNNSRRVALFARRWQADAQPASGTSGPVQPGTWMVDVTAPEAFDRPLDVNWPYHDSVLGASNEGLTFFGLHTNPPLQTVDATLAPGDNAMYGALSIYLAPPPQKKAPGDDRVLVVSFGPHGGGLTQWDPDTSAFTFTQLYEPFDNVTDAWYVDGDPYSGGFCYEDNEFGMVTIYMWDVANQKLVAEGPYGKWDSGFFPVSAYVRSNGSLLVATDGSPGHLHVHDRSSTNLDAPVVATVGNSPRRLRVLGEVGVVSNFASDTLTTFTWDASDNVAVADTIAVGDGPVGIDLVSMPGNQVAIVSTGYNDNSWSITVVDAAGREVSNTKHQLPGGATAPGHAIFVDETGAQVMVSCNGTNNVVVADSGL